MIDVWSAVRDERLALADLLDGLDDEQWATPSLCVGWSVKDVAAHVAPTIGGGLGTFLLALVRAGLNPDRASRRVVSEASHASVGAIVEDVRAHAGQRSSPPGLGPPSQLADVMVHTLDIAVPLGLPVRRPLEHWHEAMTWLMSPQALRGFVAAHKPTVTFDSGAHTYGSGPAVFGPPDALALALCGRDALLGQLSGPGLGELARWVGRSAGTE